VKTVDREKGVFFRLSSHEIKLKKKKKLTEASSEEDYFDQITSPRAMGKEGRPVRADRRKETRVARGNPVTGEHGGRTTRTKKKRHKRVI